MANSFDATLLSTYIQPGRELLARAIAWTPTVQSCTIYPSIKYGEYINVPTSTMYIQAGNACGFTSSGSTSISQTQLLVDTMSVQESFCTKSFYNTSLRPMLADGASAPSSDDISFVSKFMDEKLKTLSFEIEKQLWRGNKTTGTGNLGLSNGFLYQLVNTSNSASTVSFTSAVTSSNIMAVVDNVIYNAPTATMNEVTLNLWMTPLNYKYYVNALRDSGAIAYNFKADANVNGGVITTVPAYSNINVIATTGLEGSGVDMVLGSPKNFLIGTDLVSDLSDVTLLDDPFAREIKMIIDYSLGTAIANPSEIVIVK